MTSAYDRALSAIDAAHALDPKTIPVNGQATPYELHYAQQMSKWLERRAPDASETLKLAIRAQHFRRFEIPRSDFAEGKVGYHKWRTYLKKRQAEQVSQICLDCGYAADEAERVGSMIRKEDLKQDEETQVLEDVACLVFLEDQFEDFEQMHDEGKIVAILQKTWRKMSKRGHELALGIPLEGRAREVLEKALGA